MRDDYEFDSLRAQLAVVQAERDELAAEKIRLQQGRIGDMEIIGRWQCQAENAEARLAAVRALVESMKVRLEDAGWPHSPGSMSVVYVNDVDDWFDELAARLDGQDTIGVEQQTSLPGLTRMAVDYAEIDPGIRDTVRVLNEAGFETTDSGDGVSKPDDWYASGEAMRVPNVAASSTPNRLIDDARRMAEVLGPEWFVQAMYSPNDGIASILATRGQEG